MELKAKSKRVLITIITLFYIVFQALRKWVGNFQTSRCWNCELRAYQYFNPPPPFFFSPRQTMCLGEFWSLATCVDRNESYDHILARQTQWSPFPAIILLSLLLVGIHEAFLMLFRCRLDAYVAWRKTRWKQVGRHLPTPTPIPGPRRLQTTRQAVHHTQIPPPGQRWQCHLADYLWASKGARPLDLFSTLTGGWLRLSVVSLWMPWLTGLTSTLPTIHMFLPKLQVQIESQCPSWSWGRGTILYPFVITDLIVNNIGHIDNIWSLQIPWSAKCIDVR